MKRVLVLPAVAATVWAQTSPGEAEKSLRDQVERYYQLMMDKKFREAEKLVAEESKEDYYNGRKPDIRGFTILSTKMVDDSHAIVTIKAKQLVLMMGAGAQVFEIPTPTHWKLENGEWRWYIPAASKNQTPFGKMSAQSGAGALDMKGSAPGTVDAPDFAALQGQLKVSRNSVVLTREKGEQSFTIKNGLPGPVDLTLDPHVKMIRGLTAEIDKTHLDAGQQAVVLLKRTGDLPFKDEVAITAAPLNIVVNVAVESK